MPTETELARIWERYQVRNREWLTLEIHYNGPGEAEFLTNPGTIRGPMSIRYGEDGSAEVFAMAVEELTAEQPPIGGSAQLLVFMHALPRRGGFGFGPSNKCGRVELVGDGFAVRVAQRSEVLASAGNGTATFRPYRTIASFESDAEPRYWAVPLLNLTAGFTLAIEDLHGHPLRTRETSRYEPGSRETAFYHQLAYQQGNALIPFFCEGELGFIEPLPDYAARQARVEAGETVPTAVMVGPVREGFDPATDWDWFPSDLITLLGLATGRGVGAPFVELRGSSGELVARLHTKISPPTLGRRQELIEEPLDRSTGVLLSAFLKSEHRDQPWLRVALRHLLSAFTGDMTVEDRLSHMFRTVEGICAGIGLNSARPLELSTKAREQIVGELHHCMNALDAVATGATPQDRERIWRLKNRLREIEANRPSFPTQLAELVESLGLPDAKWLREFRFRTKIGGKPTSWVSAAGSYRNRIFHSAFIDFEKYDFDNAVPFIQHLSDILMRVIFELIHFDGRYKPPCSAYGATMHEKPDWPNGAALSAEFFGYVE
jgi:hypothetical protein